jgi:hypothetical protein
MTPFKVSGAAVLGFSTPVVNTFLENVDPVLKTLILFGQVGIAFATVGYIYYQGMQIRANLKAKREEAEALAAKRKKKRK